jgi:hypothetical protein
MSQLTYQTGLFYVDSKGAFNAHKEPERFKMLMESLAKQDSSRLTPSQMQVLVEAELKERLPLHLR